MQPFGALNRFWCICFLQMTLLNVILILIWRCSAGTCYPTGDAAADVANVVSFYVVVILDGVVFFISIEVLLSEGPILLRLPLIGVIIKQLI
jgi:hypothetical protein